MNAHELALAMAGNAEGIAQHLLPRGKRKGAEWKAGSAGGEEGDSLSVRLTGTKRGVWKDFASDEGGDLLDLWAATRGLSIAEAMVEAKQYMGIRDAMPTRERPTFKRPEKPKAQAPKAGVRDWLMSRGLTEETIAAFKIAEQLQGGKTWAVFPYLRDGELINTKYRDIAEKKGMRQEAGAEPCLFGWHLIDPKARTVAITEGEIDAMTLHQVRIPALSVNAGAGNHQWIENDWERLERFDDILICFDDDEPGRKGAAEVAQRLGVERCRLVKFGAKDANQWLQDRADPADFLDAVQAAKPIDPEELVSISTYRQQVKALFYPAHDGPHAPRLMVGERYEDCFEFRGGELSVWTGINGHGKSLQLNQVMLGLMQQGVDVCVFSGEMTGPRQMKRLVKQATGLDRPTPAYIDAVADWVHNRYWLFHLVGTAKLDRLLEVFRYGAKRYGIKHFVIDSLMMTDVPEDGAGSISAQKTAVQKIAGFAKQHDVHVHLVVHPRKGKDESSGPGKMDVGGSGHITNGADNVFVVWAALKDEGAPPNDDPDATLELLKQRNGDVQHRKFYLFFNKQAQQYSTNSRRMPIRFVNYENPVDQEQPA